MHRKLPAFFLLFIAVLCIGFPSRSQAETLITCAAAGDCTIALYRSDHPAQFQQHRIELVPAQDTNGQNVPIPTTHAVTLRYDGAEFPITCDGTWRDFGTAPGGEIQDRISCTVVADTEIHASLSLYDQNVYANPYADCPGYTIDPYLNGTSVSSPFCVNDDHLVAASACKWQKQNLNDAILTQRGVPLNDWVVYSRTNVTDLPLSYSVSSQQYPFNDGDQVCIVDLNGDGDIGQDEIALCDNTPQGYLCPLAAVQCVASYSDPICPTGGSLNPATDRCEAAQQQQQVSVSRSSLYYQYVLISIQAHGTYITFYPQHGAAFNVTLSGFTATGGGSTNYNNYGSYDQTIFASGNVIRIYDVTLTLTGATATVQNGWSGWGSSGPRTGPGIVGMNNVLRWYGFNNEPTGSFLFTGNLTCPSGYTLSGSICIATPSCSGGSYDPNQDKCYEGDNTCPYGPQYTCKVVDSISQCSPHDCQPFDSSSIEDDDTTQGENDKQDDGTVDNNGNCLGTIYIFNGKDMRCREAGLQTGFFNCCNGGSTWFGLGRCDGTEEQVWQMRQKALCHYIGDYCSRKLPLIGCVQKKQTRCCFNSKLGRILQEQGRPTLQAFGPTGDWGDPKSPNCRGFTAEEFQMLDFDNIDLSEWYGDIVTQTQTNIENTMQNKIQDFYNETH